MKRKQNYNTKLKQKGFSKFICSFDYTNLIHILQFCFADADAALMA